MLRKHSLNLFTDLQNAYDELSEIRRYEGGKLLVGVLPSELDYRLTPLFIEFHHRFPKFHLVSSVDITRLVLDTTIDIGITFAPLPDDRQIAQPPAREDYGLVVSAQHEPVDLESVSIKKSDKKQPRKFLRGSVCIPAIRMSNRAMLDW